MKNDKMPERTKGIILNVSIVAGLVWCYFRGYPLSVIVISGLGLLLLANILLYVKRRSIPRDTLR